MVGKQYALCTTDGVNVREGRTEDARVVGVMKQNTLCYILADADSEWIFVESGDVRGFVKREYLSTGDGVENQILENGESTYSYADLKISAKENKACYYTITSVKKGSISDSIRESMLKYASQFIGNPYVWGGTRPDDGSGLLRFCPEYLFRLRLQHSQSGRGPGPVWHADPGFPRRSPAT